jgi:hypothetical protein
VTGGRNDRRCVTAHLPNGLSGIWKKPRVWIPVRAQRKTRRCVLRVRPRSAGGFVLPKKYEGKIPASPSHPPHFSHSPHPDSNTFSLPIAHCNSAATRDFRQWKWHLRASQRLKLTNRKTTASFFAETPLPGLPGRAIGDENGLCRVQVKTRSRQIRKLRRTQIPPFITCAENVPL